MKTLLVAIAGVQVEGKVALIQFKRNEFKGLWGFPGGKIHDDETLPEAVTREVNEELGIAVSFQNLLGIVDELATVDGKTKRVILFVTAVEPSEPVLPERTETEEGIIDWFTPSQIKGLESNIVASDFRILEDIILGGKRGYWSSVLTTTQGTPVLEQFKKAE